MNPMVNQRMAELRMAQLHEEARHARLVKEARAASPRRRRSPAGALAATAAVLKIRPAGRLAHRTPATTTGC